MAPDSSASHVHSHVVPGVQQSELTSRVPNEFGLKVRPSHTTWTHTTWKVVTTQCFHFWKFLILESLVRHTSASCLFSDELCGNFLHISPPPPLHLEPGWKFYEEWVRCLLHASKMTTSSTNNKKQKRHPFSNNLSAKNSFELLLQKQFLNPPKDLLVATAPPSQMLPCTQQRTQRTPQHAKCHQQSIQKYWSAALQALQDVEILGQSPREDRKGLPATCTLERCVLAHTFLPNPCVAQLPIRPEPAAGRKVFSFSNKTEKTKSWLGEGVSCSNVAKFVNFKVLTSTVGEVKSGPRIMAFLFFQPWWIKVELFLKHNLDDTKP